MFFIKIKSPILIIFFRIIKIRIPRLYLHSNYFACRFTSIIDIFYLSIYANIRIRSFPENKTGITNLAGTQS